MRARRQHEKRRGDRRPASGSVTLWWTDVTPQKITARLVDTSESGFRVGHSFPGLSPGQEVQFEYLGGAGIARTIWTRIAGNIVESGLFILRDQRFSSGA